MRSLKQKILTEMTTIQHIIIERALWSKMMTLLVMAFLLSLLLSDALIGAEITSRPEETDIVSMDNIKASFNKNLIRIF